MFERPYLGNYKDPNFCQTGAKAHLIKPVRSNPTQSSITVHGQCWYHLKENALINKIVTNKFANQSSISNNFGLESRFPFLVDTLYCVFIEVDFEK